MANMCYNEIEVWGDTARIEELFKLVKSDESLFDFNNIVPQPDGLENTYGWNCEHWGTKWNSMDADYLFISQDDPKRTISFNTAWDPCIPVIAELAKKFPELDIFYTYSEEGFDFSGLRRYSKGELIEERDGEYGVYCR